MEDDLSISIEGFNDGEIANTLGNITIEVMRQLEQQYQLNISKLKKVVISFDFASALKNIACEFSHQSSPIFTNTSQAKAVAQLLSKVDNNRNFSQYALVLDVVFFDELFGSEGDISFDRLSHVIHRIHHELVHVHEHNENSLDNSKQIDDFDDVFLMTGKRAWSEFLANYMSSPTVTNESIEMMLTTLENVLAEVPREIEDLVFKYQIRLLPLEQMFFMVKEKIKLIVNIYGYAYGYISALDIDLETYFPTLLKLLSSSKLAKPLEELGEALILIKNKFDDGGLDDYDDFRSTREAVTQLYSTFGLTINRSSEPSMGLYIQVY